MTGTAIPSDDTFSMALTHINPRLVRFCIYLCQDPQAADDLVQDVMLIAWRRRAQLTDLSGILPWLQAIARNVWRNRVRAMRRAPVLNALHPEALVAPDDLTHALEDQELVTLLDRALVALSAEARAALVFHHVLGFSQRVIADRLGIAEGTVAVRLHRARQALRAAILADAQLREEAYAYGLVPVAHEQWQTTQIWCPVCGEHRYLGRFLVEGSELFLRCPGCSPDPAGFCAHTSAPSLLRGIVGYRAALDRTASWAHRFYGALLVRGTTSCVSCGGTVVPHNRRDGVVQPRAAHVWEFICRQCSATYDTQALGVALAHPETRTFWRRHKRIRSLPMQSIPLSGRAALLIRFEAVAGGQHLDLLLAQETGALLGMEGE